MEIIGHFITFVITGLTNDNKIQKVHIYDSLNRKNNFQRDIGNCITTLCNKVLKNHRCVYFYNSIYN